MPDYRIAGINVKFPFEPYDCQFVYMERVIQALHKRENALLESPTGTGKTLCLLCATLAWRESFEPPSTKIPWGLGDTDSSEDIQKKRLPTVIYASRTHSQLQQVIRELKATEYRPKMVVLGSREQMCIHSDVKQLRGRAQNQACRNLCKTRSCPHQNRVAGYLQGHPEMGDEPFDIEDLVSVGRTHGPCPYYLSRELHNTADILFAPYNYLIDKENRNSLTGIQWENTVLIFDEAHNLESICADAASFDLPAAHLTACISEARQCVDLALTCRSRDNSSDTSVDPENFAILKALLLELENKINDVQLTGDSGYTKPGPYIFEFLSDININHETVSMLLDTIDHAINLLQDEAEIGNVKLHRKPGAGCRLQTLRDALRIIFRGQCKSHAACYRFHIHEQDSGSKGSKSRTLSWWCFNPGLAMEEFSDLGVRSVILTSGTLAPLDSFAVELKLPFDVRLENPHVISPEQIWVGVVSTGPSGRPLNSSYRMRDSLEYKLDLGNTIVNFARIVPDGLLVFFPSYYLLNQCVETWQKPNAGAPNSSTVWERICKHKQPVIEPKESALFNHANEDFIAKLNDATSSGAVFFAVCRGKVSEGLDFADKAGRAVVITGIPYAMKTDPKVKLKREYLDEQSRLQANNNKKKTLTGEEWYVQQASRAVNQAVGRVIRHRKDYGAIILCDERFGHGSAQNQMSLWLRPYIKCYSKFGDVTFTLTRFFRDKASTDSTPKKINQQAYLTTVTEIMPEEPHTYSVMESKDLGNEKSFQKFYPAHGAASIELINKTNSMDFLGKKFTQPSGLHCLPVSNGTHSTQQSSLSALLANSRGTTKSKTLTAMDITPANRATASQNKKTHTSQHVTGLKRSSQEMLDVADNDFVNLASPSPSAKHGCLMRQTDENSLPKSRYSETKSTIKTDEPTTANVSTKKQVEMESTAKAPEVDSKDDKKTKNAADFLKEVRAHLSAPEYKGFIESMKNLKQKVMDIRAVLESVANIFSAPERIFLLQKFGYFVPKEHKEIYESLLAVKTAAVKELSGRQFDGDKESLQSNKLPQFQGLPQHSRKKTGGLNG